MGVLMVSRNPGICHKHVSLKNYGKWQEVNRKAAVDSHYRASRPLSGETQAFQAQGPWFNSLHPQKSFNF